MMFHKGGYCSSQGEGLLYQRRWCLRSLLSEKVGYAADHGYGNLWSKRFQQFGSPLPASSQALLKTTLELLIDIVPVVDQ